MDIFDGTTFVRMVEKNKRLFQGLLPELVKKLILNSCNGITHIRIPGKDDVWAPGFDGIVENSLTTTYVCDGLSVWEFGTNSDSLVKINADYTKRTSKPLGIDTHNAEFVMVIPYIWAYDNQGCSKTRWEVEHKSTWKNVHIYDAVVLAEWINAEPAVCAWLMEQVGQENDIDFSTISTAWNHFSAKTSPAFSYSLFLEGREKEENELYSCWDKQIIKVKADSTIDSYGFCLSSISKDIEKANSVIVVNNQNTYKHLSKSCKGKTFLLNFSLDGDVIDGNQVIVCYNKEDAIVQADVVLHQLTKSFFDKAIDDMKVPSKQAVDLYGATHGNLLSLIRKIPGSSINGFPEWAQQERIDLLAPILLLRDFDVQSIYDRNLISYLAGEEYDIVFEKYNSWLRLEDAPIKCVANHIVLVNFEEAWEVLQLSTVSPIFERLISIIKCVLDPKVSAEQNVPAYFDHQPQSRLCNLFIDLIYFSYTDNSNENINRAVKCILEMSPFPRVILQYLYLLSEAAPTIVMAFLQNDRKDDKGIVLSSFYDNGISSNDYCNVLSAIEELALHEETRVSACDFLFDLCKQTRDIQFIFSNTPRESLMKILCLWNDYTTFTVNDKLTFIKKYLTADEIFTIPFAIELIFKDHITHGVRNRRNSAPNTTVLYKDLCEAINELGAILFRKSVENHNIENILKLLDGYSHFHIDTLTEASKMFDAKDYSNEELVHLNTKLREKAFYANDAMKPWIPALSEWITVTTPHDDIARVGWLFFDYHHCCIPETLESDDWENKQKTIEKKREETLNTLISEHTLEQVKCLLKYTGDDSSFGEFFAKRLPTELLLTFADEAQRLGKKSLLYGLINNSDYNNCVRILDSLSPDEQITSLEYLNRRDIIDWIDTPEKEKSYWSHQRMIEYNDEVFQKMMKYNPTELLSFYAYFSKGMLSVSIEKIIDVFTAILALPSIKSNGRYVHEFDRILSRLDKEGYYSTELASLCASLYTEYYEMNPHSVYPNILKRYYFENPSIICDKLLRKDRDAYSHFMFYYVLPDDAYSNPDSLAFFVNTFITRHTDKDILLSALGSILGKAKDGSDGIFPHDLVRSELEKYRALRLNHEVYIGKLNSRGAHLVSDGMSLKSLAQKLASDAKKVDVMYPETAQLLRWYSDHLLAEGDHDLLYSEIGSSMF